MILSSRLFKKAIVFLVILSAHNFYRVAFLTESLTDLIEVAVLGLVFFLITVNVLFNPVSTVKKHFKTEVYLFLIAVFFSMFIAFAYHNQDFKTTAIAQRSMYFYAFYFLLHYFELNAKNLEKIMIFMGFLWIIFFVMQFIAYPIKLFDVRIGVERGTLRIFLAGLGFMFFAYYKYLQLYLTKQKIKYGVFVLLFFVVGAILQGTRQLLATMTLLTMAFIFFNKGVKSRIFIITLSSIAGVAIFFILYDMFMELLVLTQRELTADRTNIRVLAMNYFLNDFMPSTSAYIFGNGQDSMNSTYGQKMHFLRNTLGFYQSDIGIIGDYTRYGVLFVIAQLSISVKIIFGKLHPDIEYLRYLFIGLALTMFSGRNLFGSSSGIVFIVLIIYIIEYYRTKHVNQENDYETG